MAEPLESLIVAALMAQLSAAPAYTPAVQIASPLVTFSPTAGIPYLDARPLMRAQPQNQAIALNGSILYRGIFQVDAVMPDGSGEPAGLRLAAQVRDRFKIGTSLAAGTSRLQIVDPSYIAAAVKDAPWVRFPVSIPYLVIA